MKLCLHLSGIWTDKAEQQAANADIHIRLIPKGGAVESALAWKPLDIDLSRIKPVLSKAVRECLEPADQITPLHAIANDYVDYALAPVAAALESISKILQSHDIHQIDVWSAYTNTDHAPLFGVQNTEDNRGSAHLQGAYIARVLMAAELGTPIKFHRLRGDVLCRSNMRNVLIKAASTALAVFNAGAILSSGLRPHPRQRNAPIIVARSPAQILHAQRLQADLKTATFLFVPQFSLNLGGLRKTARSIKNEAFRPHLHSVLKALCALATPKKNASQQHVDLPIGAFNLPITANGMMQEQRLMPMLCYYERLLTNSFKRSETHRVINFEIKGNVAGQEARAASHASVHLDTVQTVLVQNAPMPVFPFATTFHADSRSAKDNISDIGEIQFGNVVYSGPPYGGPQPMAPPKPINKIVFFSQPYEHLEACDFLNQLCALAHAEKIAIDVRLHPRDRIESYKALSQSSKKHLNFLSGTSLKDDIDSADLGVTRVSSVAKDILSAGKPVLLALWSPFDRSVDADYVCPEVTPKYIATNAAELAQIFVNTNELYTAAEQLRSMLYGNGTFKELVNRLK